MPKKPKPEAETTGPTCGQCKHWRGDQGGIAECFFFPPKVEFDDDGSYYLIRPPLPSDEPACGQFTGAN